MNRKKTPDQRSHEDVIFTEKILDGGQYGGTHTSDRAYMDGARDERNKWAMEKERLLRIEKAAQNLIAVRGRFHTEQAYKALEEALKS